MNKKYYFKNKFKIIRDIIVNTITFKYCNTIINYFKQ